MTEISLPNTSEFAPIDMSPYILGPGEITWMLTKPVYTQDAAEFVNIIEDVAEAAANAGGVAVLPVESSFEAILA